MNDLIGKAKNELPKLFSEYIGCVAEETTINIVMEEVQAILSKYNIIQIRTDGGQHESTKFITERIKRISSPIDEAIKGLSKLDKFTKKELALAMNIEVCGKVDLLDILSDIQSACSNVVNSNQSPTPYFAPINEAFHAFYRYRFDFYMKTQLTKFDDPVFRGKITEKDWLFFTKVVVIAAHILIVEYESSTPENTKITKVGDTKRGLKVTLDSVRGTHADKFLT